MIIHTYWMLHIPSPIVGVTPSNGMEGEAHPFGPIVLPKVMINTVLLSGPPPHCLNASLCDSYR